jgi:ribosomal protein L37AE/L43A
MKRELDLMMARLDPKPKCPKCGTETTEDVVAKTYNCHACVKTWTRMEFLMELVDRASLQVLAKTAENIGNRLSAKAVSPELVPDTPIVVNG